MKAIVTVINDYGEIVEKDKLLTPIDEYINYNPKDMTHTKTTVFRFGITELLDQDQMIHIGK
jgi:hypothetical protein